MSITKKISICNSSEANYNDLKTEFIKIMDNSHKKVLDIEVAEINIKLNKLFNNFGLQDLQWRLIVEKDTIIFKPIRIIDEYAVKGILDI
jgi:hypothetical protein